MNAEKNHIPAISVIMTFYNCEKFIAQAIKSIINQTFTDFELILINDASTDDTDKIIQEYLDDSRIVYVKNEVNLKKVKNMQTGLAMAKSNIVAVMDGDDVSDLTRMQKQYDFLKNNPDVAIVGSYMYIINEQDVIIDYRTKFTESNDIYKNAIVYCPFDHPAVMYRKDVINSVGGYRDRSLSEDMDLFYRIIYSGYKGANIPEYLFSYRYHKNNCLTKQHVWAALDNYKLRILAIQDFQIKLSWVQWGMLYGQLIIGCITTGPGRRTMEGFGKKVIYGSK